MSLLPIYEKGLENSAAVAEAAIPIERATGPILLISGGDDRMWPATRMCTMLTARMHDAGRATSMQHLNIPEAGHVLFPHVVPSDEAPMPMRIDLGGSGDSLHAAHATVWPDVVRHLRAGSGYEAA